MKFLNALKIGAKFFISEYLLNMLGQHQLIELGIVPNIPIQLTQKSFSFIIIKCQGSKYAISRDTAQQLLVSEILF